MLNDQFKPPLFPIDEKRGTGNFKEGDVDRFGDFRGKRLKAKKSKPGPGKYFKEHKNVEKIIVSGCMFMSETDR